MKKLISGLSALAIAAAIAPMSAFAENETGGSTDVTFDAPPISPAYTITIPASVNLNAENPTATIKAENVYLDTTKHKQINVTLDSADYVNTGDSTFIAKTSDGSSSVTYTIGKGTATTGVKVGDTVAEFTENGNQVLSFSAPTGATYAGTHTETLTFSISVEEAVKTETLLTTLTFGGSSTYSETTSGVVNVTATNVTDYNATYGWLWFEEGSLSVTAEEGYTITKCVFIQNAKTPITDTEAPFEIHSDGWGSITEDTNYDMDGVTSIEVYGYAN